MLLTERKTIPREPGWHYEIKYDGYRLLATTGSAPRLKSKNGADATTWFPDLVTALAQLPAGYILDGEVCVLDDIGRSDFNRLHARARRKGWYRGADPVVYCVFDLLVGKGKDLRGQPLERRKAVLQRLIGPPRPGLLFVDSVTKCETFRRVMDRFTNSIREAVKQENWFSAAFLALALPDICGSIESPSVGPGERYKSWFNRYLKSTYDPDNQYETLIASRPKAAQDIPIEVVDYLKKTPPLTGTAFTAEDCYRLRCRCLHEGMAFRSRGEDDPIHFTAPDKNRRLVVHCNSINGTLQISIDIFCNDICKAVERWKNDVANNAEISERMEKLFRVYEINNPVPTKK